MTKYDELIHELSVVIPVGHSWERTAEIVSSPLLKGAEFCLVADNDCAFAWLSKKLSFNESESKIILIRNPGKGASSARNAGIELSTRKFIWFLDSDCVPLYVDWGDILNYFSSPEVVALGGTTKHRDAGRRAKMLSNCGLTRHYLVREEHKAFWAPSCNLLVRRDTILEMKKPWFPMQYPKRGGGEDVHFCFKMTTRHTLIRTSSLAVEHPQWPSFCRLIVKVARWGWAEGALTVQVKKSHGVIPHQFTPAFYTTLGVVAILLYACFSDQNAILSAMIFFFVALLVSVATEIVLVWSMHSSMLSALEDVLLLYIFELFGMLNRAIYANPYAFFLELRYFPGQQMVNIADLPRIFLPLLGALAVIMFLSP